MKKLKLYIWTDFSPDYSGGLAFAIAESEATARRAVAKANSYVRDGKMTPIEPHDWGKLEVRPINKRVARAVSGGS